MMQVLPETTFVPTFLMDLPEARRALEYARDCHETQRRGSDAAPFILHPLEVAAQLRFAGYPERIIVAAVLHDTIEHTGADLEHLAAHFGEQTARLVGALSEDPTLEPYERRVADLRERVAAFGPNAIAILAADKIVKVRELRTELSHTRTPTPLQARRRAHYEQCLAMLEARAPQHQLVHKLRFELEALRELPPGTPADV